MSPYSLIPASFEIEQGDILFECPIYSFAPPENDPAGTFEERVTKQQVIVLTQSCDLVQAKTRRVVVAPVFTVEYIISSGLMKSAQIRDQVRPGRVFGWYFLPAANDPISMAESVVDFRQLYTVARSQLEALIATGKRIGRLITPFREHLAQHFAVTYMRIALPEPYETMP